MERPWLHHNALPSRKLLKSSLLNRRSGSASARARKCSKQPRRWRRTNIDVPLLSLQMIFQSVRFFFETKMTRSPPLSTSMSNVACATIERVRQLASRSNGVDTIVMRMPLKSSSMLLSATRAPSVGKPFRRNGFKF